MDEERTKINIHSLPDLKNTTDDAVAPFLNSLGFRQIHTLTDVRLAIGFAACAIAGGTFYYDFTQGFERAKELTTYAVVAYFVLNTLLTWWIWWVEAGTVYVGEKDGVKITLGSHCEKYSPYYIMSIDTVEAKTGKKHHLQAKETFTAWFDEQGYFVPKMFQKWVSINVPDIAAKKYVVEAMERAKEEKVKK